MTLKKKISVIFISLLIGSTLMAQTQRVSKSGTSAVSFLEIGVGSRAVGMGGAFVAMADDVTALYWNPAGIARLNRVESIFIHAEWIADTDFDFAGVVIPLNSSSSIGFQFTSLTMGDMKVRTVFFPEGTGEVFTSSDVSMGITYAYNFTDRFSFGVTGKYIQEKIWHMKASTLALDLGTLFNTQYHGFRLGMSVTNFGNKMQLKGRDTAIIVDIDPVKAGNNDKIPGHLDTDKWPLPLLFRVGIAFELLDDEFQRLSFSTTAQHPNNNPESMNFGMEYAVQEMIFLRVGYQSLYLDDSEEGLTAGGGLSYGMNDSWGMNFDYSWSDFGVLSPIHRFSLGIEF